VEYTALSNKVKKENYLLLPGIEGRLCGVLTFSVSTVLPESSRVSLYKLSTN